MSRFDELRTWRWLLAAFFLSVVQYARADDQEDFNNLSLLLGTKVARLEQSVADLKESEAQQSREANDQLGEIRHWIYGLAAVGVGGAGVKALAKRRQA